MTGDTETTALARTMVKWPPKPPRKEQSARSCQAAARNMALGRAIGALGMLHQVARYGTGHPEDDEAVRIAIAALQGVHDRQRARANEREAAKEARRAAKERR